MKRTFLIAAASLFSTLLVAQDDIAGKEFNIRRSNVQKNIHMIRATGGNIGLSIGKDGVFMIDDQFADAIPFIMEEINDLTDKPVAFIINTHHHGDHVGGNAAMAKEGAVIVSHANVRRRLEMMGSLSAESREKMDAGMLPLITFTQDMSFHYNGEEIRVFYVREAHTDGDAMVHFLGSNVLHTGDAFVNETYPYIDIENGGTLSGYIKGLETILQTVSENTKIIPGHGPLATSEDVRELLSLLQTVEKKVDYHYRNEKTEDEVAKMTDITQDYDRKGFGNGFISREKLLRTVYKEVSNARGPIDKRSMEERLKAKVKAQREGKGGK